MTLLSAPAGFGKTTLVIERVAACERKTAWLVLDEADIDPFRFPTYIVAALQTIVPNIGEGALVALQSPQPPTESILTAVLNEITAVGTALPLTAFGRTIDGGWSVPDGCDLRFGGPSTLAMCAEDSLEVVYLDRLGNTATYVLSDGKLVLNLQYDSGNMESSPQYSDTEIL